MTQTCIQNLFLADIELFFANMYAVADSLYPPTEMG